MSKRVLVVEDQVDNMRIMNDMLASVGYEVIKAVTGHEGVAMAATHKPDLILMDVMLPGLDGYEATRRIKQNAALRHIPIIAVRPMPWTVRRAGRRKPAATPISRSRSVRARCSPRSANTSAEPPAPGLRRPSG